MQTQQPAAASADVGTRLPPYVPAAPHADQRYFNREERRSLTPELYDGAPNRARKQYGSVGVGVYRNAFFDHVEVSLQVSFDANDSKTTVNLNAKELREVAARLLDAAHDLEVNPTRTLVQVAA